jgi:hypothetical protein
MIVNAWHGVHGLTSYPPNYLEQGELRISYNLLKLWSAISLPVLEKTT